MSNSPSFLPLLLVLGACGSQEQPRPSAVQPTALAPDQAQALRASPPAESDLPPLDSGTWPLACGATLELEPAGGLRLVEPEGTRPLGGQAVGLPALSADHSRLAFAHAPKLRPETVVSVLSCDGDRWGEPRTLAEGPGSPDRVAISPDGAWVAWFSGASGVASLWAAPFDASPGDAHQYTNASIDKALGSPGTAPPGFVPPPHQGPPTLEPLEGDRYRVSWSSPDGEQGVVLP
jgi:hypothetical protein